MPRPILLATALLLTLAGCAPAPDPANAPAGTTAYVRHLQPDQLDTWRGVHYDALVLDLRSLAEYDDDLSHLDNSTVVPIEDLESRLEEFAKWRNGTVLLYDRTGSTLVRAGQILVTHGFQDVYVVDGGLKAYRDWQTTR
jgi:rhodanese-related sulfurtransferase